MACGAGEKGACRCVCGSAGPAAAGLPSSISLEAASGFGAAQVLEQCFDALVRLLDGSLGRRAGAP